MRFLSPMRVKKLIFKDCTKMPYYPQYRLLEISYDLEDLQFINSSLKGFINVREIHARKFTVTEGDFSAIQNFSVFPLEEVDVSKSNPSTLVPLVQVRTLKKVIISEKMKALDGYHKLSKRVELIVK